jgi:hypothetical protein
MITLTQCFLLSSNATVSRLFADILLDFLMSKIGELSGPRSDMLMQLFKLGTFFCFTSLVLHTSLPVSWLVSRKRGDTAPAPCLHHHRQHAMGRPGQGPDKLLLFPPLAISKHRYQCMSIYLTLSISNFQKYNDFGLSKEFLPIVSSLLEGLNTLQDSSHSQQLRDLFIGMHR